MPEIRRRLMVSRWCARLRAAPLLFSAASLASCGSGGHGAPPEDIGTISLELVAHTPDASYHLRMAEPPVTGSCRPEAGMDRTLERKDGVFLGRC